MDKLKKRLAKLNEDIETLALKDDVSDDDIQAIKDKRAEVKRVQAQIEAFNDVQEQRLEEDAEAEAEAQEEQVEALVEKALKARDAKAKQDAAKANRLPDGSDIDVPAVAKYGEYWKYDNLDVGAHALMIDILNEAADKGNRLATRASQNAMKALAVKIAEGKDDDIAIRAGQRAMKAAGIAMKADEIQQQDLTGFGDEFVGVAYSNNLWELIRIGTFVVERIPTIEVPAGHESIPIPVEGADMTFYKVLEATDTAASGWPNATITSSQAATTNKTLSLAKMGARLLFSGELNEDSLIPWTDYIRNKMVLAGAEQLEHAVIDGDTDASATTNINDIAGTPGGSELFLLINGFRKLALVTNTANSRSAGVLTAEDFLETVKLMGTAGQNALDIASVSFIQDLNTRWKSLPLAEVKTRDVNIQATIENGQLTNIYGYDVDTSAQMHRAQASRLANTAGKIDLDTGGNNTTGSLLAVRWDQWLFGFRRRMTVETTRIARADTTEIVALSRLGLVNRDNEASAISYNITV